MAGTARSRQAAGVAVVALLAAVLSVVQPSFGQVLSITGQASTTTGIVSGTLVYAGTGEPLPDFHITFDDGVDFVSTVTDASGQFSVEVAGDSTVSYSSSAPSPSSVHHDEPWEHFGDGDSMAVPAGQTVTFDLEIDPFLLADGYSRLLGTVTAEEYDPDPEDSDVFGAIEAVNATSGELDDEAYGYWKGEAPTRALAVNWLMAGSYKLEVGRASMFTVTAHQFANGPTLAAAETFATTPGEEKSGVEVDLVKGGSVSGVVTYTGTGAQPVTVRAFTPDGSRPTRGATVADDGSFTIKGLSDGDYRLAVWRGEEATLVGPDVPNATEYLYAGDNLASRTVSDAIEIDADYGSDVDLGTIDLVESVPATTPPPPPASSPSTAPTPSFSDIPSTHTFVPHITWLAERGITSGFDDGTFKANQSITRGQLAVFLYKLAGEPAYTPPATSPFPDVPTTNSFYKHISWLESRGVISGFGDGTFRPQSPVTRGQFAVMLYKTDGSPDHTPPSSPAFTDLPPSHSFSKHISWLSERELVNGFNDGTFRSNASLTRGQIAVILYKYDGPGTTAS